VQHRRVLALPSVGEGFQRGLDRVCVEAHRADSQEVRDLEYLLFDVGQTFNFGLERSLGRLLGHELGEQRVEVVLPQELESLKVSHVPLDRGAYLVQKRVEDVEGVCDAEVGADRVVEGHVGVVVEPVDL